MGDFNARIGSLPDTIEGFDVIPPRTVIDTTLNQHGHEFLDFLNDAKFCVLNGRLTNNQNGFTSVSRKGRAVVDYVCIPQDQYVKCKSFNVMTMQSIVDRDKLHSLLGERSRLPDHSAIIVKFTATYAHTNDHLLNVGQEVRRQRYKVRQVPNDFMNSNIARLAIIECIDKIESCRETQAEIDDIYRTLCDSISEMDRTIPKSNSRATNKRYRMNRPYWNDSLTDLWNTMREKECVFLKCPSNTSIKYALRRDYIAARDVFDKALRREERAYRKSQADVIETMSTGLES
jgi:hypothetical protein